MADLRVSIYDGPAVDAVRSALRFDPHRLHRLRVAWFKKGSSAAEALDQLPIEARDPFASRVRFDQLTLDRRFDSEQDGASKLVLRTDRGFAVEGVILRAGTGRVALCVSSQVGCAAACDFCATGRMGVAQSLTPAEILDQLRWANRLLVAEGRRVRNIVFMGMGEPFHNEPALHACLTTLTDPKAFGHPPSRILVSTVGVIDGMRRLAQAFPTVNQALSLHSCDQATRERIIPLARRYPLDALRGAVAEVNALQPAKTSVMLEHLMLQGVNDSPDDAQRLIDWTRGLRVHVNLIPYNPVAEAPHLVGSSRETIEAFGALVRQSGSPVTIRYSMGRDIDAACGQLVKHENRRVAHQLALTRRDD